MLNFCLCNFNGFNSIELLFKIAGLPNITYKKWIFNPSAVAASASW